MEGPSALRARSRRMGPGRDRAAPKILRRNAALERQGPRPGWSYFDSDTDSYVALTSAEVYDPTLGAFSPIGDMKSVRKWHMTTALPNCEVLLSGGNMDSSFVFTSELLPSYRPKRSVLLRA
jgi:hypothetical protein